MLSSTIRNIRGIRIRGNPKALARLVAFFICIALATAASKIYAVQPSMIVSTFAGAALGLAVNWIVLTLEEGPNHTTPQVLIGAAHNDVEIAGYYRTAQTITIRVLCEDQAEYIEVHFGADIVALRSPLEIERQDVGPPQGTELVSAVYKVNGNEVAGSFDIQSSVSDELIIRYRIKDDAKFPIEDEHFWPSPVLDYVVRFEKSEKFSFQVGTMRPAGEIFPLNPKKSRSSKFSRYEGRGPAFSTQGLRWEISRTIKEI
jgi:hypothetical protein